MKNRPQSEAAYERLRDEIVDCRLHPGFETTEGELSARYGFGKAAVRVALVRLGQDGLVRALGRRGYLVRPITLGDVEEVFAIRAMLDAEAARLAAGRVDVAALRRWERKCLLSNSSGLDVATPAFRDAHSAIHLGIAAATGNRRLLAMTERNLREVTRLLHLAIGWLRADQVDEHRHDRLIAALEAGDAAAAEREARHHVEGAKAMVMQALIASPEVRDLTVPLRQTEHG